MESANGLVFGFIPKDVMIKCKDKNWRQRVSAIVDIENLVVNMSRKFEPILPYMSSFVRFVKNLLEENNFKTVLSILNIVYEVASF